MKYETNFNSIRAFLFDSNEFLYPETLDAEGYSVFYGILAGYDKQGKGYDINYGTGEQDRDGNEVYTGDTVDVYYYDEGVVKHESAFVYYSDGCFSVTNQDGLDVDIGSCVLDERHFVAITGHIYA